MPKINELKQMYGLTDLNSELHTNPTFRYIVFKITFTNNIDRGYYLVLDGIHTGKNCPSSVIQPLSTDKEQNYRLDASNYFMANGNTCRVFIRNSDGIEIQQDLIVSITYDYE